MKLCKLAESIVGCVGALAAAVGAAAASGCVRASAGVPTQLAVAHIK
ncbi:MAG: hypothetical protein ACK4ZS_03640 [Sulfurimicrobium sp.]